MTWCAPTFIPFIDQGGSGASLEPVPASEPVLCILIELVLGPENWFQSGNTLLVEKKEALMLV